MAQYIPKEPLVAEIKRRMAAIADRCDKSEHPQFTLYGKINALEKLLPFINTLEVKEVDLEKAFDEYTLRIAARDIREAPFTSLAKCAKHFFELGLKAQKGE